MGGQEAPEIDKLLADVLGEDGENSEAKAILKHWWSGPKEVIPAPRDL